MREMLKFLKVIQTISNIERRKNGLKKIGRGYTEATRLNPYNPLSYVVIVFVLIIGIAMYGFYGFWRETDLKNPFSWI